MTINGNEKTDDDKMTNNDNDEDDNIKYILEMVYPDLTFLYSRIK